MSAVKKIQAVSHGLQGELRIPGDKSISHRSVMFAGLADTPVHITNFLPSADCLSTAACMEALGATVTHVSATELIVTGHGMHGLREPETLLDAGNSGTTLRLMMGMLATQPFLAVFTGDASLSRRPMGRVIEPLTAMGSRLAGRGGNRFLPIAVLPPDGKLQGIHYQSPVASAQVKSAILLAGLFADGRTTVVEPYTSRDHTERMLEGFGIPVEKAGTSVSVQPAERLCAPAAIEVPGDISSAAYWLVAASVSADSELLLKNVGINPTRTGILDVLWAMGADITVQNERQSGGESAADLLVRTARLHGTSFGAEIMPRLIDEIPALAVAAMFADGDTEITGAGELRVKETDRLQAITDQFNKLADCIEGREDGLLIHGGRQKLQPAQCFSYDDHRIAMSLAIAGAAGAGVEIRQPDCVRISYPSFYEELQNLAKQEARI